MNDTCGMNWRRAGVFSSAMLKPLKMIISTMIGGNIASAASDDGAAAPRRRPRPPDASPSSDNMARKLANFCESIPPCSPTSGYSSTPPRAESAVVSGASATFDKKYGPTS